MSGILSTLATIWRLASPYFRSEERWAGRTLLGAVIAIMLADVGIDVLLNQWNARFYNSLQDRDWDAFTRELMIRRQIDRTFKRSRVTVEVVHEFDNIETIKNLVEIGSGVSILPIDTVEQELRAGTLAVLPFVPEEAFLRPTGMLVKHSVMHRPAVRVFLETIRLPSVS